MHSDPTFFLEHIQGYCSLSCPEKADMGTYILEFMAEQGVTSTSLLIVLRNQQTYLYSLSIHQFYHQLSK